MNRGGREPVRLGITHIQWYDGQVLFDLSGTTELPDAHTQEPARHERPALHHRPAARHSTLPASLGGDESPPTAALAAARSDVRAGLPAIRPCALPAARP